MAENLPWEDLDILLDIPGLGIGEAHDDLEEFFTVCFAFGDCFRMESLEIATNAILLFDGEAQSYQLLEQLYRVYASGKTFLSLFPPNAADAYAVWLPVFWCDWSKFRINGALVLRSCELHKSALRRPLLRCPVLRHGVKLTMDFEDSLLRIHVGIEATRRCLPLV